MLGMFLLAAVIILLIIAMIGSVGLVYGKDMPAREWKPLLDRHDVLILDTETTELTPQARQPLNRGELSRVLCAL